MNENFSIKNETEDYLDSQIDCIDKIKKELIPTINEIIQVLLEARERGKNIYIFGNGGSGSTASHFTSDLLKTSIIKNEKKFRVISLVDNIPVLLAWANDTDYENIFVKQLENFVQQNDLVIGISGSGNSKNVLKAIEYANTIGATTISFTGMGGGKIKKVAKINLIIPSDDMLFIETMHLLICHLLTTLLRKQGEPLFLYR